MGAVREDQLCVRGGLRRREQAHRRVRHGARRPESAPGITLAEVGRRQVSSTRGGHMPQGAWSDKRERQYEHIKESEKKQGRSTKRAREIAAATVNKQRAKAGETKSKSSR